VDFDEEKEREEHRREQEAEDQRQAQVVVETINKFIGQRCCVFLDSYDEENIDAIHGRLMAVLREWPAIVVRDLTPGVERLQRKRLVSTDSIRDVCLSPGGEQCVKCPTYKELLAETEKEASGVQPA